MYSIKNLAIVAFLLIVECSGLIAQEYKATLIADMNKDISPEARAMGVLDEKIIISFKSGSGYEPHIIRFSDDKPIQLADINPGKGDSNPQDFIQAGSLLYFTAESAEHGRELWRTDGTASGTLLVKDLFQGSKSSRPLYLTPFGDWLVFAAEVTVNNQTIGREFCRTKGHSSTTYCIDFLTGEDGSYPSYFEVVGSSLIFRAYHPLYGSEPFKVSQTNFTPVLVKDINPGTASSNPADFTSMYNGTMVLFSARTQEHGTELWQTKLTPETTFLVKDIVPGSSGSDPAHFAQLASGLIIFSTRIIGVGEQIWRTFGNAASTSFVKQINTSNIPSIAYQTALGNRVLFTADDGVNNDQVWVSDGTTAGTFILKKQSRYTSRYPKILKKFNNILFYADEHSNGKVYLYQTDGTAAGTKIYTELWDSAVSLYSGRILFSYGNKIALLLAVRAGTTIDILALNSLQLVKRIDFGLKTTADFSPTFFGKINNKVILQGFTEELNKELYTFDTENEKITLLKDIMPGKESSSPYYLGKIGNEILFGAMDTAHGHELWISDGTSVGTRLLKDIVPGPEHSSPYQGIQFGNKIVFHAETQNYGRELWITDGTSSGTKMIKDINPGLPSSDPTLFKLGSAYDGSNKLYFTAKTNNEGKELWVTNGTSSGTLLVKDINPGASDSSPIHFTFLNGILYFMADSVQYGRELYRSYGTNESTKLVIDLNPGPDSGVERILGVLGNGLMFAATPTNTISKLYRLSSTSTYPVLVKEINSDLDRNVIFAPGQTEYNKKLLLDILASNIGSEPWVTDGTANGTVLLADLNAGIDHSSPVLALETEQGIFFSAENPNVGRELFYTDNTKLNTRLVADINKGSNSSEPWPLFYHKDTFYLAADNGKTGKELFKLELEADSFDECPTDRNKTKPGECGCGIPDVDTNANNIADCLRGAEIADSLNRLLIKLSEVELGLAITSSGLVQLLVQLQEVQNNYNNFLFWSENNPKYFPGLPEIKAYKTLRRLKRSLRRLKKYKTERLLKRAKKNASRLKAALI